jgi:hypothetical protein
LSNTVEF